MADPYTTLGISKGASQAEIKKAYRKLAKESHPDSASGDPEHFKQVSAAYELLKDKDKRARYDRGEIDEHGAERTKTRFYRAHEHAGARPHDFEDLSGGFNPEEVFADLFGGLRGGRGRTRGRSRRQAPSKGADVRLRLEVSFLDAAKGSKQRLKLSGGKTVDVTVPAGIDEGQTIRLKGQGGPGRAGGPAGDALIEVHIEPHPFFTRKGNDIHVDLPVTLPEAVHGATIQVPTIDGQVSLKVPKGSNTGTTLRLKNKGVRGDKGGKRGDQYMRLLVVLPEKLDPEIASRIAKWAENNDYDVRGKLRTK
jgi:DnaJ-class molecular chaperone